MSFRPTHPATLAFMKMHAAGNDFVVVDGRDGSGDGLSAALIRALGDRHRGIGFDQFALISHAPNADLNLSFRNADGSASATCGNATRCIAAWEMARRNSDRLTLRTERGLLHAECRGGAVHVNLGAPLTEWRDIPLGRPVDTLHLPIEGDPVATGMGNPHCTFFVDDADRIDLAEFGPAHEGHELFPERTNVELAEVTGRDALRLRIWERGTGITLASGSCACAAAVAAARRGLTGRQVGVTVDGGEIGIDWRDDGVWLTGPTAHVFDGALKADFLAGLA